MRRTGAGDKSLWQHKRARSQSEKGMNWQKTGWGFQGRSAIAQLGFARNCAKPVYCLQSQKLVIIVVYSSNRENGITQTGKVSCSKSVWNEDTCDANLVLPYSKTEQVLLDHGASDAPKSHSKVVKEVKDWTVVSMGFAPGRPLVTTVRNILLKWWWVRNEVSKCTKLL